MGILSKTRVMTLSDGGKSLTMCIRLGTIAECDGRTERQTEGFAQWRSYGGSLEGPGPQSPEKKNGKPKNENLPSASLHQLENSTSLCQILPFCLSICCKHLSYLLLV